MHVVKEKIALSEIIKSSHGVESFSFNSYNIENMFPDKQYIWQPYILNDDMFVCLCKKNPDLKELNVSNNISKNRFQEGIKHLKCLKTLSILTPKYDINKVHSYSYLSIPEIYNIKEFKHSGLELHEIELLKNFTDIEKMDIGLDKNESTINNTIENLTNSPVKELQIVGCVDVFAYGVSGEEVFGNLFYNGFNTSLRLPPKLQKLILVYDHIDFAGLLRLVTQSNSLTELHLKNCFINCYEGKLIELFSKCKNLEKIYFTECAYDYGIQQNNKKLPGNLINNLKTANPKVQIVYERKKQVEIPESINDIMSKNFQLSIMEYGKMHGL